MRNFVFFSLVLIVATLRLGAHEVEQHFMKLTLGPDHLSGRLEMDVGYTLPEMRSNEDDTMPTLTWLDGLPESERARILVEGKAYLTEVTQLSLAGEPLELDFKLAKWGTDWPIYFDQRPDTFARMVWEFRFDYEGREGLLELHWNEPQDGPSLALATSSGERELPLVTVSQGEIYSLANIEAGPEGGSEAVEHTPSLLGWLRLGFQHVIPKGLDHILFILGIFFLSPKWKVLLTQSLIFTIAHSVTLALTVTKTIPVNPGVIEPLIALSIAYVAIENLFLKELKPWRLGLIFALGLLHGMGFGSVMSELPVDKGSLVVPLVGFNLGVEVAQVTILMFAVGLTFWFQEKKAFQWLRIGASVAIAITGLVWTVQRLV